MCYIPYSYTVGMVKHSSSNTFVVSVSVTMVQSFIDSNLIIAFNVSPKEPGFSLWCFPNHKDTYLYFLFKTEMFVYVNTYLLTKTVTSVMLQFYSRYTWSALTPSVGAAFTAQPLGKGVLLITALVCHLEVDQIDEPLWHWCIKWTIKFFVPPTCRT